jgi:hypothetical protein
MPPHVRVANYYFDGQFTLGLFGSSKFFLGDKKTSAVTGEFHIYGVSGHPEHSHVGAPGHLQS